MFFILSKILKVFLMPMFWVVTLFILAYLVKNKKWRKGLFIGALTVLLIFSDKPLMQYVQYLSTKVYSHQQLPKTTYPVAVVMGGFGKMDTETGQISFVRDRGARLWEPIRLYHCGIVDKILISGDATSNLDADGNSDADLFLKYMQNAGVPSRDIILEQHARNTRENATYSTVLLDSLGYADKDCLLITSATHMKRTQQCFLKEGWTIDPYAVNIYPKPHPRYYEFFPSWKTITDWEEILNEWFGNIAYKIVGYR